MLWHVAVTPGVVHLSFIINEGGLHGHVREQVRPGETILGKTYDELVALGTGEHELDEESDEHVQRDVGEPSL